MPTNDTKLLPTTEYHNKEFTPFMIYIKDTHAIIPIPYIQNIINEPAWIISKFNKTTKDKFTPILYTKIIDGNLNPDSFKNLNIIPCLLSKNWKPISTKIQFNSFNISCDKLNNNEINFDLNENNNINNNNDNKNDDLNDVPDGELIELSISDEKIDENFDEKKEENSKDKNIINNKKFDVDDIKIININQIGIENIVRITNNLNEFKIEWNKSELGIHDELDRFLDCKGKVIDISEDDDTIKLEWQNKDTSWIPAKACWLTWKNDPTNPKPLKEDLSDNENDLNLLENTLGL